MESGALSQEHFINVLRSISQRRRNGILELTYTDQRVLLKFSRGRLVDMHEEGIEDTDPVQTASIISSTTTPSTFLLEFVDALSLNKLVAEDFLFTAEAPEYFTVLSSQVTLKKEQIELLYREQLSEKFLKVQISGGAIFTFSVQMVGGELDSRPSVPAGQLLLRLAHKETVEKQFSQLCEERNFGIALAAEYLPATVAESVLAPYLQATQLSEIPAKTLLSRETILEVLKALQARQMLLKVLLQDQSEEQRTTDLKKQESSRSIKLLETFTEFRKLQEWNALVYSIVIIVFLVLPLIIWGTAFENF